MALPVSTASNGAVATSVTVTKPVGGWLSGNLLIAVVSAEGIGAAPTTPAGWTLVTSGTNGALLGAAAFSLLLSSGGAASYTFTGATGTSAISALVAEYSGSATATNVQTGTSANGASATATWAAVTTAYANEAVLLGLAANTATVSSAWPTGYTLETSQTSVAAVAYLADAVQATAGSTGTPSVTLSVSDNWVALTVALLPAVVVHAAQSGEEIVGADSNPPVNVAQSGEEFVGADSNPPVRVGQSFQEIVQATIQANPTYDVGKQNRNYRQFFEPRALWLQTLRKAVLPLAPPVPIIPGIDPGAQARRYWQFLPQAPWRRSAKSALSPPRPPYVPTTDTGRQLRRWIHYFYEPPDVRQANQFSRHARIAPPPLTGLLVDGLVTKSLVSDTTSGPLNVASLARKALLSGPSSAGLVVDALVTKRLVSLAGIAGLVIDAVVRKTLCLAVPAAAQAAPFIYSEDFGAIPIFPTLPVAYPLRVSPGLDTTVGTTKSLREMRYPQRTTPLWDIEVPFEELRDQTQNQTPYGPFAGFEQYQQLVQTWLMMYGQSNVFAFECPWDNSRTGQVIGTGDGETWGFQIYSTWGLGAQAQLLPVGYVGAISTVYVNGIAVPQAQWTFSRDKLYFISATGMIYPPAAGAVISLTFSYYYLCRFTEDEQDFEEFAKNRWVVPSLKFRAVLWL